MFQNSYSFIIGCHILLAEEEQVYVNSSAIESKSNAESIPILDCPEPDSVEMKMKEEITEPNDYEPVSYETEMEDETITKL